jgi:hypothetical protein
LLPSVIGDAMVAAVTSGKRRLGEASKTQNTIEISFIFLGSFKKNYGTQMHMDLL